LFGFEINITNSDWCEKNFRLVRKIRTSGQKIFNDDFYASHYLCTVGYSLMLLLITGKVAGKRLGVEKPARSSAWPPVNSSLRSTNVPSTTHQPVPTRHWQARATSHVSGLSYI